MPHIDEWLGAWGPFRGPHVQIACPGRCSSRTAGSTEVAGGRASRRTARSGAPRSRASVALEGDRIAAVGPTLTGEAARTIDAAGRIVAPGFIDAHSHS